MKYIIENKSEPPKYMRHDPHIIDNNSRTMSDYWITYVRRDVPEWMRPMMLDTRGLGLCWKFNIDEDVPEWIHEIEDNYQIRHFGKIMLNSRG